MKPEVKNSSTQVYEILRKNSSANVYEIWSKK